MMEIQDMSREVDLRALLKVFRDGDERGWVAEFAMLWHDHRERMSELLASIRAEGIREPIVLGADGRVWDGHHRLAVAHKLSYVTVPVVFAAAPDPEWEYATMADEVKRATLRPQGPRILLDDHPHAPEEVAAFPAGHRVRRRRAGAWEIIPADRTGGTR